MTSTLVDRLNGVAEGLAVKAACVCATTGANIALAGVQAIDGITVGNACERVLVKDQTDATTNGIYVASTGNWTRALDFDGNRDAIQGTLVYVFSGGQNAGSLWALTTANPVTFGASAVAFAGAINTASVTAPVNATWTGLGAVTISADIVVLSGFRDNADLGFGLVMTSIGATAAGWLAARDKSGKLFNAVFTDTVDLGWFGAYMDGASHPIASGDIAANPQWRGSYGIGTEWDTVAAQEWIFAGLALDTPATSGGVMAAKWNCVSGGAGTSANKRMTAPPGTARINAGLIAIGQDCAFAGSSPATTFAYYGNVALTGTTNGTITISNVPAAALQLLSTTLNNVTLPTYGYGALYIDGPGIPDGTQIAAVNVSAGTITLSAAATTSVSSWIGYGYSGMLSANSLAYCSMRDITFSSPTRMPCNAPASFLSGAPAREFAASWTALVVLDHASSAPNLATQYLTFYNVNWVGNDMADVNISISPRGGAAEGATISFYNCSSNHALVSPLEIGGSNALGINWHNGDFLSNWWCGPICRSGTLKIDTATFEGQIGASFSFAPQCSQIVNGGVDTVFGAGQGDVNLSMLISTRSEASVLMHAFGQTPELIAPNQAAADLAGSYRSYPYQLGSVINPGTNNAQGRVFVCVDTLYGVTPGSGAVPNQWFTAVPNATPSAVVTDNSGNSYSTNALAGLTMFERFGSNGFTNHLTAGIVSNTATAITVTSGSYTPASDTLFFVGGQSDSGEPSWDDATSCEMDGGSAWSIINGAGNWSLTAGSITIAGPSGMSVGDYIVVPRGDTVGLPPWLGGKQAFVCPFIAKIVTAPGGTAYTVSKAPKRSMSGAIGMHCPSGNLIVDGNMVWAAYDFNAVIGAARLIDPQLAAGRISQVAAYEGLAPTSTTEPDRFDYSVNPGELAAFQRSSKRTGRLLQTVAALGNVTGTLDLSAALKTASVVTLTPTGNLTLEALTAPPAGYVAQEALILIVTSGTTSYTISAGTNVKFNSAALSTGTVSGALLLLKLASNNGVWVEAGRYPAASAPVISSLAYAAKTADYAISAASDYMIDLTSGSHTFTLPTAVGIQGQAFVLKNSGSGTLTIATTSAQTVDGGSPPTLPTQYSSLTVESDNANWKVI